MTGRWFAAFVVLSVIAWASSAAWAENPNHSHALGGEVACAATKKPKRLSDGAIAKILIDQSIARYRGSCPCPYNRTRRGRRCGRRSAYSKPGGYAPLCYRRDVTRAMIQAHRDRQQPTRQKGKARKRR